MSINASIGLGLAIAQNSMLFALPFLTIVMFSNAAAFPAPAATVMAAATGALMTGVALLIGAHQVLDNPAILVFPLALLGAVSIFGNAVGAITMRQRWAAATDQLTGLLNRNALHTRTAELAQGASGRDQSVALMVADLDHFKAINDQHGHACGDHVLAGVAERIQAGVRLFDPVYRIGGEEFVALLVGASLEPAAVAERIRDAVSSEPIAGIPVTVSIGVAVSPAGEPFDYETLFAAADAALRHAKADGRNRVLQAVAPVTTPLSSPRRERPAASRGARLADPGGERGASARPRCIRPRRLQGVQRLLRAFRAGRPARAAARREARGVGGAARGARVGGRGDQTGGGSSASSERPDACERVPSPGTWRRPSHPQGQAVVALANALVPS